MRHMMKKWLSAALCMALVACTLPFFALAAGGDAVTLRVEGVDEMLLFETLPYEGETVLELLLAALDEHGIDYNEAGGYISEIAGEQAGAFGGWDGWVYYVNYAEGSVSMAECTLEPGDSVLVCYADPYGEDPTLVPSLSFEKSASGLDVLVFTAEIVTFDADWNMTVSIVPIVNATVTVDGREYITGEDGKITLSSADSAKSYVTLQIDKRDENGKPLVLRFEPGLTVELPHGEIAFNDVSDNTWYRDYVIELVQLGAINGYGDGTFRPTASVTRAEFVKILACLDKQFDAGAFEFKATFADVKAGDWFAPYVMWAVEKGIVEKAENFYPATSLAREDMALYSYRMAVNVLGKVLPDTEQAPAFVDDAQISARCKEAVYLLQKAGIINGVGNDTYAPLSSTQRSQAAKVVTMIYNLPDAE